MASGGEVTAPPRNPFPFQHKPNALDRDKIVIPAGWDSWGKIAVLRDGFDAKLWGEAWENDLDGSEEDVGPKATKLYTSLVPDLSRKVRILSHSPSQLCAESSLRSLHLSRHSTTRPQSRRSSPRTTTRTQRTRTATRAARSGTRTRPPPRASSGLWAAAASRCPMSSVRSPRWRAPPRPVRTRSA